MHFTTLPENLVALDANIALTEVKNNLLGFDDILNSFPFTCLNSSEELIVSDMVLAHRMRRGADNHSDIRTLDDIRKRHLNYLSVAV
jgi:hypothetical protein